MAKVKSDNMLKTVKTLQKDLKIVSKEIQNIRKLFNIIEDNHHDTIENILEELQKEVVNILVDILSIELELEKLKDTQRGLNNLRGYK